MSTKRKYMLLREKKFTGVRSAANNFPLTFHHVLMGFISYGLLLRTEQQSASWLRCELSLSRLGELISVCANMGLFLLSLPYAWQTEMLCFSLCNSCDKRR